MLTENKATTGSSWHWFDNKKFKYKIFSLCFYYLFSIFIFLPTITTTYDYLQTDDEYDPEANVTLIEKVRIISRIQWIAQPPVQPANALKTPVPYVVILHSATDNCSTHAACVLHVRYIQTFHIDSNGWWDIGFNFLVGGNGLAYEGRGWTKEGAFAYGYNARAIGIAFIGTFNKMLPPPKQILAAKRLIALGVDKGYIAKDYKLLALRQLSPTQSPGDLLYENMKKWAHWINSPDTHVETVQNTEKVNGSVALDSSTETIRTKINQITPNTEKGPEANVTLSDKVRIISRFQWVAQPPVQPANALKTPVPYVVILHSATDNCSTQAACMLYIRYIQSFHVNSNGWWDIGYNFLVGGDGLAYEGRGWEKEGAFAYGYNSRAIGIAFIGTFNNVLPPPKQIMAAKRLIALGVDKGYIAKDYKLLALRQLSPTQSPGDLLYADMKKWPHWVNSLNTYIKTNQNTEKINDSFVQDGSTETIGKLHDF